MVTTRSGTCNRVDAVVLSRDPSTLRPEWLAGLEAQGDLIASVHGVVGERKPLDPNRWETIARARNRMRTLGESPYVLFLDDDVVLGTDALAQLTEALDSQSNLAAAAADYLGEVDSSRRNPQGSLVASRHVAMGAVVFRRKALMTLRFRWEKGKCECLCCCEDLRRRGLEIAYLVGAPCRHLGPPARPADRINPAKNIVHKMVLHALHNLV